MAREIDGMNDFNENDSLTRNPPWESVERSSCLGRFLVPLSLSEDSHAALSAALQLARDAGGQVVLLHAVELNIAGEERGVERVELLHELMNAAEARLTELAARMCGDVPFTVVVDEGRPSEVILRTARTLGVDAILMGTRRGRGLGWPRRNNLRTVLRRTRRPVYVVVPTRGLRTTSASADRAAEPSPVLAWLINRMARHAPRLFAGPRSQSRGPYVF